MRILIADSFPESTRAELRERGHECRYHPDTTPDGLAQRLTETPTPDVLVVRSTRVTGEALREAAARGATPRMVIRAGSGTNTIDSAAAGELGIHVCNVPGRNAIAVAELAFALLLALDRNIADNVADLRAGNWDKARYAHAAGIAGRRIGVLGLGNIGLAFAERARVFGAEVYAVSKPDRSVNVLEAAERIGVNFVPDLPTLARTCDVLSLHLPVTESTRNLLDRETLGLLRPGTIVLNTARAELVDEQALLEVMDARGIRAGLDVFADEPASSSGHIDSRLARHPNVYGTHHIGASTTQAQHAVAGEVVRMIDDFTTGTVRHRVNGELLRVADDVSRQERATATGGPR